MSRSQLETTNFDHEEIKASLIEFLKSTNEFDDFNYEGSAINTIVDLLTRNTTYAAYMANMLANESFIDSAQLRGNVVSHAQKLSYTPRSYIAARTKGTVEITPVDYSDIPETIEMPQGTVFLSSSNGQTYSFVTNDTYILEFNGTSYEGSDIEIFQGQRLTNSFIYNGQPIEIPNSLIDTSTLSVTVTEDGETTIYSKATSLKELSSDATVYFLSENNSGQFQIDFGRDIIGNDPLINSVINITYILTEEEHANGLNTFISASTVSGYSNITFTADDPAWGGSDRETIEDIRFIAPKFYQAQDRALNSTDYIPIIKAEFPFIRSVIVWGGEENDPPRYGQVFMSFISDEGRFLTESIKDAIVDHLQDYNVGSVTPEIVDPIGIGINLNIEFSYDSKLTNKTFNQLSSQIHQLVNDYNESEINEFGKFFNDAYLINQIMKLRGLVSANIMTTVYREFGVLRFVDPIYEINFDNPIKPGSISMSGFEVDPNGLNHCLIDDEEGTLFVEYELRGATQRLNVGTVDYETGEIEFVVNMLQDANTVTLYANPAEENFYIKQNKYLFIDEVDFDLMQLKWR